MKAAYLVTILLGGVAALDATAVAQTLLSQPLITATILGWVWGDWTTAVEVGVVLQILAASTLPVGARTPEDYASGGVVGAGLALALSSQLPFMVAREGCVMLGVLVGMVTAVGGVPLIKWQRRLNEGLSRWCEDAILRGDERALGRSHAAAIVLAFAVGVGYCAACLGASLGLLSGVAAAESLRLAGAWGLAQPIWIGIGLAQILHAFVQRRLVRGAAFGAALVAAWLVLMVGAR
jgi:mannose/fructose/N-acetylgalactosamine-specific phosphotransferase system component IIC